MKKYKNGDIVISAVNREEYRTGDIFKVTYTAGFFFSGENKYGGALGGLPMEDFDPITAKEKFEFSDNDIQSMINQIKELDDES